MSKGSQSNLNDTPRINMVVGAVHLRKYGKFVENHVDKLEEISKRFNVANQEIFGCHPVSVKLCDHEFTSVVDIVTTDNKVLNKIVTAMAALCLEVRDRVKEAKSFYNAILVFGEKLDAGGTDALTATSKFLPDLQNLANFVERCQIVIGEFLQQLAAVYTISTNNQIINATNMHFEDMMQHLGDLLVVLVSLDALVESLEPIKEIWALYKRLIPTVQIQGGNERTRHLISAVDSLEKTVLSSNMFRGVIDRLNGWKPNDSSVAEELQLYVKNMLNSLEVKENKLIQDSSMLYLRTGCVFTLTALIFGVHDKRLLKQVIDMSKRYSCVPLAGSCMWNPDEFYSKHLSHIFKSDDKRTLSSLPTFRADLLTQRCKFMSTNLLQYSQQVSLWTIDFDAIFSSENSHLTLEDLDKRCQLFIMGVKLAGKIKRTLRLIISLYAVQSKPMTRSVVLYLCGLIELLSAIARSYRMHCFQLAESTHHVSEYLAHGALTAVVRAKGRLSAEKNCNRRHLDALSALLLAQLALSGPVTSRRLLVARLALSVARGAQSRVLREEEIEDLYLILQQLDQLASLQYLVHEACDASHLYYQRVILPIYLDQTQDIRLPYILSVLPDASEAIPEQFRKHAMSEFESSVTEQLQSRTLRRACERVETNLRLQVHAHIQKDRNLPEITSLSLQPLRLFDKVLNVKADVEAYLDKTFYNLTTVALHDWRSYGEMRALAKVQMGLSLVKDCLPCQTLEQGLDVLEVIRNIHVFVASYQYNMNNQLFVERESANKHLNTIGIRHVSNSIRTHGTGIVNTTVNFIYQFLRNKFYIFSQFLFDEQIKSRLAKDALFWRDAHGRGEDCYPYERADKFVKGIRKLGMTDNQSYLDQFRILITHIGNAMGYVRLVRSGGMHACSNSLSFLPETELEFSERCTGQNSHTLAAAAHLDKVVQALAANFADGSHYFRMLVDVFAADFRNPKHSHLNNFYMIVPPLTISYVDQMLAGKEKVARKKSGIWTDDGFAMGLAYVLTLLGQHDRLASLHWFSSAKAQHKRNTSAVESAASLLTAKRLSSFVLEFDLLAFNLNSAKIFFKKQVTEEVK